MSASKQISTSSGFDEMIKRNSNSLISRSLEAEKVTHPNDLFFKVKFSSDLLSSIDIRVSLLFEYFLQSLQLKMNNI